MPPTLGRGCFGASTAPSRALPACALALAAARSQCAAGALTASGPVGTQRPAARPLQRLPEASAGA